METRANYVIVGSVVLGAIAALILFVAWLAHNEFNKEADIYYTYFSGSVAGLQGGSPVRYRGVPVGTVGNIEIDPGNVERIRVTLKLNPGTPIKVDSIASLEMAGITGGSYVEITGGTQSSPPLTAPDDQIPVIKSQNSSLMSLEEDAPKLLGKLIQLADRANDTLTPENVRAISQTLDNLRSVTSDLKSLMPQTKEAVSNVNHLVADLHTQLPRLIDTLQQDGVSVRDAADEFRKVAAGINSVLTENRGPLRDFTGTGLYEMTALMTELRGLTDSLQRVADRLDRDPQRYLFGGANTGVDPNRPISVEGPR